MNEYDPEIVPMEKTEVLGDFLIKNQNQE